MKKRIAIKIIKAVLEYKHCSRWDMPYNGKQIYQAAKRVMPPFFRDQFKGWKKETTQEGQQSFLNQLKSLSK